MNVETISHKEMDSVRSYNTLVYTARQVCTEEDIDFDNCLSSVKRAMLCYWCSICRSTYPLTDIVLRKRKKICCFCNNNIKLYANSNKYGKIRRKIFYRYLEGQGNIYLDVPTARDVPSVRLQLQQ